MLINKKLERLESMLDKTVFKQDVLRLQLNRLRKRLDIARKQETRVVDCIAKVHQDTIPVR